MKRVFPDLQWWMQLEPQWKQAFAEIFFRHSHEPTQEELAQLLDAPALRLAGPSAPYPNMSFELNNLSGITRLSNLEVLVVIHHQVETIQELKFLTRLKSLFLHDNQITSLSGVEELTNLEQLYVQWNKIESIRPVQKLVKLRELYIHNNLISHLEGLTEAHADKLEKFFCKPNDRLKQNEILRVETKLGIMGRSL